MSEVSEDLLKFYIGALGAITHPVLGLAPKCDMKHCLINLNHRSIGAKRPFRVHQVNSALHPSGVDKSSTSFGWGKGGKVTTAGWQVTLCDPIWHVISRSGEVISITNCYIRVYFTF